MQTFVIHYSRKLREALRNPPYLFMAVFMPLMYLVLFSPLLKRLKGFPGFEGGSVLNTFLPGILVVLSVFGGLMGGFRLCDEIRQGIIERFRVTPTSRLAILMGSVVRDVTTVLFQALILAVAALPFGLSIHWIGMALLLVMLAVNTALFAGLSYGVALYFQSEDKIAPLVQGLSLPLLLLAGFLLPMSMAPGWLKTAAHFDPVYYSVEGARAMLNGKYGSPAVWEAFAVNVPLLSLILGWAASLFRTVVR